MRNANPLRRLALALADLIAPVLTTRKVARSLDAKAEALFERVRGFKPKHPILRPSPAGERRSASDQRP